jgi:hypothetical protein
MSHHQNTGQNYNVKTANDSIEKMEKFKHLGTTVKGDVFPVT